MKTLGIVSAATIIVVAVASIFILRGAERSRIGVAEEASTNAIHTPPNQATTPSAPAHSLNGAEQRLDSMPADSQKNAATPMRTGAEFDRMFENQHPSINFETAKSLHSAFQRQSRDDEWAPSKERQISDQYVNNPLAAIHGSPIVTCKASMCEVRLLSNQVRVDSGFNWGSVLLQPLTQQIASGQQTGEDKLIGYMVHHDEGSEKTAVVLHLTFQR